VAAAAGESRAASVQRLDLTTRVKRACMTSRRFAVVDWSRNYAVVGDVRLLASGDAGVLPFTATGARWRMVKACKIGVNESREHY